MKKLALVLLLIIAAINAKAQLGVNNSSPCSIDFRAICINTTTCAVTYPLGTGWTTVPASTAGPITPFSCGAGTVMGMEVRYTPSTGCTNAPVRVHQLGAFVGSCPITQTAQMGACLCSGLPTGPSISFDAGALHIN